MKRKWCASVEVVGLEELEDMLASALRDQASATSASRALYFVFRRFIFLDLPSAVVPYSQLGVSGLFLIDSAANLTNS